MPAVGIRRRVESPWSTDLHLFQIAPGWRVVAVETQVKSCSASGKLGNRFHFPLDDREGDDTQQDGLPRLSRPLVWQA